MKRVISLLFVVMLIAIMVVPALASDFDCFDSFVREDSSCDWFYCNYALPEGNYIVAFLYNGSVFLLDWM